jgi:hypothetical protein
MPARVRWRHDVQLLEGSLPAGSLLRGAFGGAIGVLRRRHRRRRMTDGRDTVDPDGTMRQLRTPLG